MLQEQAMREDPTGFRMLVGCVLLNQTGYGQVSKMWDQLWAEFPSASHMRYAGNGLVSMLRPLGLQNQRAKTLLNLSRWWCLHRAQPDLDARVSEMEPPGIGEYARDSWIIFKMQKVPDWTVKDKELRKYLRKKYGA